MSVYIIAEAGVNHNGSLKTAMNMVDEAKKAGADCIKFQTFVAQNIASKNARKADYQKANTDIKENQLDMLKKLELSFEDFKKLNEYCKKIGIEFMSTAFDIESIDFLNSIGMNKWKIPSGDITNLPYLIKIAQLKKPVILSTGMSTYRDIELAISALENYGASEITVLHCTTEYPTPLEDVNLSAMNTIQKRFNLSIGYSDHTEGIEIAIAAVARGAEVIEKHFTLDRNMKGPDHQASLEPHELRLMIDSIRKVERSIGDGEKKPAGSEIKNMNIARKSIIAKCYIKKGEILSEEKLTVKRPGNGISPMKWYEVIGTPAIRDFKIDELIDI